MAAVRLLIKLVLYYAALAVIVWVLLKIFPTLDDYLPIGRVQSLITQAGGPLDKAHAEMRLGHIETLGSSIVWLVSALLGALFTALPVSWVYMETRNPEHYDQSLVGTIVMLPVVVTSIVVIVQNSLALSFSLAGIAGVARFRNSMKSAGDLLYILISIGIGLAAGIGAVELAIVTSIVFNLCFVILWAVEFGERSDMKRYWSDFDPNDAESTSSRTVSVAAMVVTETESTPKQG